MAYNFNELKNKTKEVEDHMKKEFSGVRTGRATPSILDSILVESYGSKVPIVQVGNVSVEDARTLRISPWDTSHNKEIEKAIVASNLGLSTVVDDSGVRVIFPELTEERRKSLIKILKEKMEDGKVRLRTSRDHVWKDIQDKEKAGTIREDEKFRLKDEMQKVIDNSSKNLEDQFAKKEKEILG